MGFYINLHGGGLGWGDLRNQWLKARKSPRRKVPPRFPKVCGSLYLLINFGICHFWATGPIKLRVHTLRQSVQSELVGSFE